MTQGKNLSSIEMPACMFCGEIVTDVRQEIVAEGLCWVVVCPCEEWEVPGARSWEQALDWFAHGNKGGKSGKR